MKSRRRELLFRLLEELLAEEDAERIEAESALRRARLAERPASIEPTLMTVSEAAEFLNLSKQLIYRLVHQNRIPHYRPGGSRRIRLEKSELLAWLRSGDGEQK